MTPKTKFARAEVVFFWLTLIYITYYYFNILHHSLAVTIFYTSHFEIPLDAYILYCICECFHSLRSILERKWLCKPTNATDFFLRAMVSESTWTTVSPALSISSYEIRPGDKVPYIIIIYVFTLRCFWAPFIILLFISLSVFYEEFKASAVSKNEGVFVCLLACLPACFVWLCFHIVASGCLA